MIVEVIVLSLCVSTTVLAAIRASQEWENRNAMANREDAQTVAENGEDAQDLVENGEEAPFCPAAIPDPKAARILSEL